MDFAVPGWSPGAGVVPGLVTAALIGSCNPKRVKLKKDIANYGVRATEIYNS